MNEKAKKALKKFLWSFCCFIGLIVAVNWVLKSYNKDMEEKKESIAADVTQTQSEEKDLKSLGTFSNGFAYLLEDRPEIGIISLDYTNNSGDVTGFSKNYRIRAFQNGIELEKPIVISYGENEYKNRDNGNKNIKDGITITIEQAYNLENTDDEIEIEIYYTTNMYMSEDTLIETINVKITDNPYKKEKQTDT